MSFSRPMTLAELIQETVLKHPSKSVPQIAEEMWGADEEGKPKDKKLYREILPTDHGAKLGVLDLIPLCRATGNLDPIYYICRALGLTAFPIQKPSGDLAEISEQVARTVKEFGEMLTEISGSLADDDLNETERLKCLKETYDVRQALAALYVLLDESGK